MVLSSCLRVRAVNFFLVSSTAYWTRYEFVAAAPTSHQILFASHVIQTLQAGAPDTITREAGTHRNTFVSHILSYRFHYFLETRIRILHALIERACGCLERSRGYNFDRSLL